MKKKTYGNEPSAWRTKDGRSIVDLVIAEAKGRGLRIEKTVRLIKRARESNELVIQNQRCEVLPARIIDTERAGRKVRSAASGNRGIGGVLDLRRSGGSGAGAGLRGDAPLETWGLDFGYM